MNAGVVWRLVSPADLVFVEPLRCWQKKKKTGPVLLEEK